MRNVIAIVLGIVAYTGLLFTLLGLVVRLVDILPVMQAIAELMLTIVAFEMAFRISLLGAAAIYTRAYALKVLGILMAIVILAFNMVALGQSSWVFHVIGLGFMIRVTVQGIRFGEPEYKTTSEVKKEIEKSEELTASEYTEILNESKQINKKNITFGLMVFGISIVFSGVVSWIMFAVSLGSWWI